MTAFERDAEGRVRVHIPPGVYAVPAACFGTGSVLGMVRGAREASLRFLAENAHRRPTTVQGWYFYKKTKNYRVMWGALKGGAHMGIRMGAFGGVWVGLEHIAGVLLGHVGWPDDARSVAAGIGSAGLIVAGYRLPRGVWGQVMGLGVLGGGVVWAARLSQQQVAVLSGGYKGARE